MTAPGDREKADEIVCGVIGAIGKTCFSEQEAPERWERAYKRIEEALSEARRQERMRVLESEELKNLLAYIGHSDFCLTIDDPRFTDDKCDCGLKKAKMEFDKLKQEGR